MKTVYKLVIHDKSYYYGDYILRIAFLVINMIEIGIIIYLLVR